MAAGRPLGPEEASIFFILAGSGPLPCYDLAFQKQGCASQLDADVLQY